MTRIGATEIQRLQDAVYDKRPILRNILEKHGDESVFEYAKTYRVNPRQVEMSRKAECIGEITQLTHELLGAAVAESVARQLNTYYYVSTTDHHGPLTHPFFVHADLLSASSFVSTPDRRHENTIVLACSNVSLGNSSLPRSLLFTTEQGELKRLNFFPASDRHSPVFRFHPYSKIETGRMKNVLRESDVHELLKNKLFDLMTYVYEHDDVLAAQDFSSQVTKTNQLLWERSFSGTSLPRMVSLNQEEITNRLLRKYHLYGQTELTTFLFDAETLARIETAFEGLPSAFSKKDLRGTFLFWYFPIESKKRIALWLDGKHLVSADGVHRIPLTPESLDTLLEQKLLIPSMMLSLVTLSFYYGIKCLGGFSQVNYLTWFDKAYRDVLNQPQSAGDEFTQGFCGEFLIGFLKTTAALTPATGIDFVIHADDTAWKRFESVLMHLSLRDVHSLMLPELYRVVYNNSEREEALLSIKFSDMSNVLSQSKSLIPTLLVNS